MNPRHLEALKLHTLSTAGIKSILPMNCRMLSVRIMQKTKLAISETTLKRVFGFAASKFNPSMFTLNALAIYCGYQGFEEFCNTQLQGRDADTEQLYSRYNPHHQLAEKGLASKIFFEDPLVSALLNSNIPTVLLKANAPDFTIITYNEAYGNATYSQATNLRGLTLWEAFNPARAGGYGPTLLLESFREAIFKKEVVHMAPLHFNIRSAVTNIDAVSWWDNKILPVVYNGVVKYLLVQSFNITDKVLHQDAIEEAIIKELTLAENLAALNVNLKLTNQKLVDSYEELSQTKTQLEELNRYLESRVFERTKLLFESEVKQRKLIDNAPVAVAVLKGPDHIIEAANEKTIEYWGKTSNILNKPLLVALPELKDQPGFTALLNEVQTTGIPYANPEFCILLNIDGVLQARYYDMVYQPVQHITGLTDTIFIVAFDVTDHVKARQNLQQSESMLRLAVNAANIGTWTFDPKGKVIKYNAIFAQILGWDKEELMGYDETLAQVPLEYRDNLVATIEDAIANGSEYDVTYAQRRFNDGKLIYLRAAGKITLDDSGQDKIFSGILRELSADDMPG